MPRGWTFCFLSLAEESSFNIRLFSFLFCGREEGVETMERVTNGSRPLDQQQPGRGTSRGSGWHL